MKLALHRRDLEDTPVPRHRDRPPERRGCGARGSSVEQHRRLVAGALQREPRLQARQPRGRGDAGVACDLRGDLAPCRAHSPERGTHRATSSRGLCLRALPVAVGERECRGPADVDRMAGGIQQRLGQRRGAPRVLEALQDPRAQSGGEHRAARARRTVEDDLLRAGGRAGGGVSREGAEMRHPHRGDPGTREDCVDLPVRPDLFLGTESSVATVDGIGGGRRRAVADPVGRRSSCRPPRCRPAARA